MKTKHLFLLGVVLAVSLLAIGAAQAKVGRGSDTAPAVPRVAVPRSAAPATVSYTYDAAGRLVQVSYGSGQRITYTYDAAGNLLRRSVSAGLQNLHLPVVLKAAH